MTHWTEDLFVERPELFAPDLENRVEAADGEVDALLETLDRAFGSRPETALDVACGIGRHVVALAERGLRVDGLDVSGAYLDRARERAREAGVADRVILHERDMREVADLDGEFDLATLLYNSLGYYDTETDRSVLAGIREVLAPGGVLAVEVPNKEGLLANFDGDAVHGTDERLVAETAEYDPYESRYRTTHRVIDPAAGEYLGEFDYEMRVYAPVELRDLLRRAGYGEVRLYGGFEGRGLAHTSQRLVAIARAPGSGEA